MNRREFMTTTGAVAAATTAVLLAQSSAMAEDKGAEHASHEHHTPSNMALMQATANCLMAGQMCIQHGMMLFSVGDTSMVACTKTVNDMGAVCTALQQLAAAASPFLPAMAKLAAEVCDACEKECRKHEEKHMPCKACADACRACAVECRKVAG